MKRTIVCRGTSNLAEEHQFVVAICLWKAKKVKTRTQTHVYFCMNFMFKISQKRNLQSSSNFHSIFALMRNRSSNVFRLITQPWRHLGAILRFHFIIHIFITIHHKLTKFSTHKLHVMTQQTNNPCPCAHRDAHTRARQNFKWL